MDQARTMGVRTSMAALCDRPQKCRAIDYALADVAVAIVLAAIGQFSPDNSAGGEIQRLRLRPCPRRSHPPCMARYSPSTGSAAFIRIEEFFCRQRL